MYVFSEFLFPLLLQILSQETCLERDYSVDMFQGSPYPLGWAMLTLKL